MTEQTIILTWPDHTELTALVEAKRNDRKSHDSAAFDRLARELARAKLVASHDTPPDVVTMNSSVRVKDMESEKEMTFTLSWPHSADAENSRINVLAPLGMALLGCRVGQEVEWPVPNGNRYIRVEEVLFQPENQSVAIEAS